jgi:hypothetical protein
MNSAIHILPSNEVENAVRFSQRTGCGMPLKGFGGWAAARERSAGTGIPIPAFCVFLILDYHYNPFLPENQYQTDEDCSLCPTEECNTTPRRAVPALARRNERRRGVKLHCHCEERSDVAISHRAAMMRRQAHDTRRKPFGGRGIRIATPSCGTVRNDTITFRPYVVPHSAQNDALFSRHSDKLVLRTPH